MAGTAGHFVSTVMGAPWGLKNMHAIHTSSTNTSFSLIVEPKRHHDFGLRDLEEKTEKLCMILYDVSIETWGCCCILGYAPVCRGSINRLCALCTQHNRLIPPIVHAHA